MPIDNLKKEERIQPISIQITLVLCDLILSIGIDLGKFKTKIFIKLHLILN